jgi:hypothetical protein
MRGFRSGFFPASEGNMTKRKHPHTTPERKTTSSHGSDRRNQAERRADDRRAHARFEPASPARSDRRQGERRRS